MFLSEEVTQRYELHLSTKLDIDKTSLLIIKAFIELS